MAAHQAAQVVQPAGEERVQQRVMRAEAARQVFGDLGEGVVGVDAGVEGQQHGRPGQQEHGHGEQHAGTGGGRGWRGLRGVRGLCGLRGWRGWRGGEGGHAPVQPEGGPARGGAEAQGRAQRQKQPVHAGLARGVQPVAQGQGQHEQRAERAEARPWRGGRAGAGSAGPPRMKPPTKAPRRSARRPLPGSPAARRPESSPARSSGRPRRRFSGRCGTSKTPPLYGNGPSPARRGERPGTG